MEKLADISQFESFGQNVENGGQSQLASFNPEATMVENLDLVSEANPPSSAENPPPKIPQWGRSLGERVGKLEQGMAQLEQATRAGFEEVKADIAEIKQAITRR